MTHPAPPRLYNLLFDMIDAGEFTPETALAEAEGLMWGGDLFEDSRTLLITWAWEKQDWMVREAARHTAAAVKGAEAVIRAIEWNARPVVIDTHVWTGEEPF